MTTFADLGLSEDTLQALQDVGYEQPSPIQEQAIPLILAGQIHGGVAQGIGNAFYEQLVFDDDGLLRSGLLVRMLVLPENAAGAEALARWTDPVVGPALRLLHPVMPFLTEELWQRLGHSESLAHGPFPVADPALLINDRPPDLVFQKSLNTFAKRHHVRIWKLAKKYNGREVWVGAATHDIATENGRGYTKWTHRIDPHVDRERDWIQSDLLFSGMALAYADFDRPHAPKKAANATGDDIVSDGKITVVDLGTSKDPNQKGPVLAPRSTGKLEMPQPQVQSRVP